VKEGKERKREEKEGNKNLRGEKVRRGFKVGKEGRRK
jgi:hypothetical protein